MLGLVVVDTNIDLREVFRSFAAWEKEQSHEERFEIVNRRLIFVDVADTLIDYCLECRTVVNNQQSLMDECPPVGKTLRRRAPGLA